MVKFLDLKKQYEGMREQIDAAIRVVIEKSAFIGGEFVESFNAEFARFLGVKHCIGVGNGTDALEIALKALDLPKGSEVLVPANSFIATSEAVSASGHRVVFCDCNDKDYTICLKSLESKITPRTKAIIAVHLYGTPCNMDAILEFAKLYGLKVVEDCAQAHGAEYKGKRVGGFGDISTFSFYPGKNLGAYGDAGAIATNDATLAKKCQMIANHGRVEKYNHIFEGRNSRLDGMQAAILSMKLKHLESFNQKRREIAKRYLDGLKGVGDLVLPKVLDYALPVWHLFVVRSTKRDALAAFLREREIEVGIHYPIALPDLEAYKYLGEQDSFLASKLAPTLLSLPIGEHLEVCDIDFVVENIREFFAHKRGTK